jgi:O-methyltransferase
LNLKELRRQVFRRVQGALYLRGFDLQRFAAAKGIPDAELYGPFLQPWRSRDWQSRLRTGDGTSLVTPDRKYVLCQFADQAAKNLSGEFFECGVYRGGTAYLLAEILSKANKRLSLFDTFEGMPEADAEKDRHCAGDFDNTTLASVQRYLSPFKNVAYYPGFLPETFAGLESASIAFAHIDLDIYEAIRSATAFIYPRLVKGGVLIYDDYGLQTCPGARRAVDDFFSDKTDNVVALLTGQGLVIRMS